MGEVLVIALLGLSMVPLCGYGGQVSLCQYTFLGVGCVVMAKIGGGDSLLGVLAAIGACAGAGAVLALPAIRLRGLYMGLLTLAFAVLMDNLFFTANWAMGNGGTLNVGRPNIFGLQFTSNRSFVILLAVVLAACIVGVGALRRSRYGRRLVGMSESPAACTTIGLNLTRTRLLVFTLSAGMAGLAGALFGGQQGIVSSNQFQFELSLAFFASVMISGASTLIGPLFVGVFLVVVPIIGNNFSWGSQLLFILAGLGAFTIQKYPHGTPQAYREGWERVRAMRSRSGPPTPPPAATPEAVSQVA
jgi:branched-chain amino acid transport system permease protein